jgi:hypothetical protein
VLAFDDDERRRHLVDHLLTTTSTCHDVAAETRRLFL